MTTEERMTINERYKYLRRIQPRYLKAGRKEKSHLLDDMQKVTGLHRKTLTRLMKGDLRRKPRTKQRGKTYGTDVVAAMRVIWESMDYPCAERLAPNLDWMAKHLIAHRELKVSTVVLEKLGTISISTVERRLQTLRQHRPQRPRRKPPRARNTALEGVPMGRIPWDVQEPGHMETDTVHHCGASASGEYVYTVQMVDVKTGWSERRATLGKSYTVMEDAFRNILKQLPFAIREVHPDNGSEFFNHHLVRFWKDVVKNVQLSRSRPYHKNDNPFVEQRNANPVRTYLGHDRLDTVDQTLALNDLYDKMRLYHNFFQPVLRVVEKTAVSEPGQRTRIRRRRDDARTPFDRLCQTDALSPEVQAQLTTLREQTNPLELLRQINEQLEHIFSLPCRTGDQQENIYDTLTEIPDPRREQAAA